MSGSRAIIECGPEQERYENGCLATHQEQTPGDLVAEVGAVRCPLTAVERGSIWFLIVTLGHQPGGRVPPREIEDVVASPGSDEVDGDCHCGRDKVGDPDQEAPVGEVDEEPGSLST